MAAPLKWDLYANDHMSAAVDKLGQKVDAFSRKLDAASRNAKQYGANIGQVQTKTTGLTQRTTVAQRAVTGMGNSLRWVAGVARTAGTMVVGAAASAALAFGAAGGAATMWGIKTAAANETALVSFEVLLGSQEKALGFLKQLQDFAAATPFDLPSLRESASRLLAVGVATKDIIPLLTRLGDATAGMGTGAFGIQRAVYALQQMRQAGKVTLEDINQLTDAGIPALDALSTKLGLTVAELRDQISEGKIKPDALFDAILDGTGKGFKRLDGMMEKQSQTLEGKWSSFVDNAGQAMGKLFEPAMPGLKKGLDWLATNVPASIDKVMAEGQRVKDIFKGSEVPPRLMQSLRDLKDDILPALRGGWDRIVKTIEDNKEGLEKFGRFLSDVIIPAVGFGLVKAIDWASASISTFIWWISKSVDAFDWLVRQMLDGSQIILTGLAKTFGWIPGLGPKLKQAEKEFKVFADKVRAQLDRIQGKWDVSVTVTHHGEMKKSNSAKQNSKSTIQGPQQGGAFADGGWASGRIKVGEHGPEEIDLGAQVGYVSSRESLGAASNIEVVAPVVIQLDGYGLWQGLLRFKKRGNKVSLGLA